MTRQKFIWFFTICLIVTSFFYYFHGYKDNLLFSELPLTIIEYVWYPLFIALLWNYILKIKVTNYEEDKAKWIITGVLIISLFLAVTITLSIYIDFLETQTQNRVTEILQSRPTRKYYANVINIENQKVGKGRRAKWKPFAIIEYYTGKRKITRSLNNEESKYKIGETVCVTYSVDYPEMCQISE